MKRLALLLLLLPLPCLRAQTDTFDTAWTVVERYRNMLHYDALPKDSMLVMETTATIHGQPGNFLIKRWFVAPDKIRVEVWDEDSLTAGYCTNGADRYREYSPSKEWWSDLSAEAFALRMEPYDFRCPLHDVDTAETTLTYAGSTTLRGFPLQAVKAEQKGVYSRYYLFEEQSGLLLFIIETDEMTGTTLVRKYSHSDWKAFHEYQPVGGSLIASEESYQREGRLTIMKTTAHFERIDALLFNQDTPR